MLAQHPRFKEEQVAILMIKNACVETVLMSVRDLDDFFRPRDGRDRATDLRASDFFNYTSPGPFLSRGDRDTINQWLAHLTSHPILTKTSGVGGDPPREWNTAELVGKAARAIFSFFDHVHGEIGQKNHDEAPQLIAVKKGMETVLKNVESIAAIEDAHFGRKRGP